MNILPLILKSRERKSRRVGCQKYRVYFSKVRSRFLSLNPVRDSRSVEIRKQQHTPTYRRYVTCIRSFGLHSYRNALQMLRLSFLPSVNPYGIIERIFFEILSNFLHPTRRDDSLLTVDFNLRQRKDEHARQNPEETAVCRIARLGLFLIILNSQFSILNSQVGGSATYSFLDLTPSATVAALGGKVNAITGSDPSLAFYNPAVLDSVANNCLAFNFVNLFAGINFGYAAYSHSYNGIGNFAAGIHYVNYGKFTEADESGLITGNFTAAEYAFNFTYSRQLPYFDSSLYVGINVKPLLSVFERYTSYGLLSDLGITYRHPNKFFTAALVLRNMGGQITPYSDGGREPVPFELQFGLSQRLQYAPFRFSLIIQHLQRPQLGYNKVNLNPQSGQKPVREEDLKKGFDLIFDETLRHLIFGVECFPFEGLVIRAGYNYNRRQEMQIETKPGMVGFSWGLGLHLSRFSIDYSRSAWHLAGASDHISVIVKL